MVKNYLFEHDIFEDPLLPSPNQLKYKILIKNKKLNKQPAATKDSKDPNQQQQQHQQQLLNNSTFQQQHQQQHHTIISTPKKQLSQVFKSSLCNHATLNENSSGQQKTSNLLNIMDRLSSQPQSVDETIILNEYTHDVCCQLDDQNLDNQSTNNDQQENSKLLIQKENKSSVSSLVQRIKFRLNTKQNVTDFIHKSKSLTDSAFNRLITKSNNKIGSKLSPLSSKNDDVIASADNNGVSCKMGGQSSNLTGLPTILSNPSVSASITTSVAAFSNTPDTKATNELIIKNDTSSINLMDRSYLSRIRRR